MDSMMGANMSTEDALVTTLYDSITDTTTNTTMRIINTPMGNIDITPMLPNSVEPIGNGSVRVIITPHVNTTVSPPINNDTGVPMGTIASTYIETTAIDMITNTHDTPINANHGSIKIILGCMYSGKTSELIREYRNWSSIGKKPLCINYSGDDRYGNILENNMYNHNKNTVECVYVNKLSNIDKKVIIDSDIILINEGQFFDDIVDMCTLWCDEYGKNIVVNGLDGDSKRRPFGKILELIPFANSVTKLNALCGYCLDGTLAQFTHRTTKDQETIIIGNDYVALCRNCYLKATRDPL